MSRVRKYTFSTTFFQSFSSFTQRTASVDHIIDQYAVTTCNVTDDMHHLGNVRTRTTFVDDCHIGIVQQLSDSAGTHNAADVRRNHNRVIQIQLQHVFQQDRATKYVINRNVEETLNLFSVQIHCQHTVNTDAGEEVCNHFRSDWYTSGTDATVLARIAKVGDNSGDTTCGSTTQGINHND